jgi:hypothetical protein
MPGRTPEIGKKAMPTQFLMLPPQNQKTLQWVRLGAAFARYVSAG